MKVIVILDQIQSGLGGKERADTELGGKRIAMGSAETLEKNLKRQQGEVIATFYCGTDYYQNNSELVQTKFTKMAEKMKADVVVLGPTYDYPEFSTMACEIAEHFQTHTKVPAIVATAIEKNADLIAEYKEQLTIVKVPKKGGTGLSDSLNHIVEGCKLASDKADMTEFKQQYCYQ
ncbi:GrdB-related putative oxidoreductase [Pediococcus ethanolidurans]|uniref:Glycine reductase n=1 Tax=Pediococcus ethanolidurans TaxID=319653 RepID=A0A0R2K6R6_9LACO|nr:GrdB-related putative oxidoreductase [Pediococcus ethanolidurans]KRN82167.1 hypothetical protein IV87_GL000401 [Pediococcus ethanolidurans]GEN95243.1 proline reductase [Pediococcus ethanolidurans]SER67075.1 glycine reductase [Pediococcus ethanolidurans]